ncbi:MAG: OmpA family protein [Thiofilum sp.]|uniref:OmpA family protein n=1 Tax=Thiofilum sp. TaxID=2212733 RepID=UPI0025F3FD77|nr:OmpA family protein [Thiofilum sp.]MBK8452105.1 OmpA family protein [Thiofilum sp.]
MKITKRYLLSQWLLLPLLSLSCSSLVLANELADFEAPEAVLTLEDDYVEQPDTEVQIQSTAPNAHAQAKALANEDDGLLEDSQTTAVVGGSKSYMGGNTRIGVSVDTQYKLRLDGTQVFSDTKNSVTSGEGWVGFNPKAKEGEEKLTGAGVKVNHHWVGKNDTGGVDRVHKVFGAYDQNEHSDKKITAGYGQETQNMFWSGQASMAKGDDRIVGYSSNKTAIVERPYDYGVGARVGTFLPNQLMQVQGGVDLEFGKNYADNEKRPTQVTVSGGVEKFFMDSPHSVGANIELLNKTGGTEGEKTNDARGSLSYRYEFGGAGLYEPNQVYKRVRVEMPGEEKVVRTPAKIERKMIKNTMELEGDTFFERGKAVLLPAAKQRLQSIMAQMRNGVQGNIHIVGNTCDLGSDEDNQLLSEQRANAVRDYFIENGFDPDTLLAEGVGEANPKYPNDEAHRYRNRRVDVEYMTYQTDYKEVVVDEATTTTVRSAPRVTWRQELVKTPPKWVERALRNNIQHKRSIDTYRTGGVVNAPEEGDIIVARKDDFTFYSGDLGKVQVLDILRNDNILAGTTIKIVSNPNNLVLAVNGNTVSYTPSAVGKYSFTYKLVAPDGSESNVTTANITVDSCFAAGKCSTLELTQDTFQVALGDSTTYTIPVLKNDKGEDLRIISVSEPKYGTAVISSDGKSIMYTLRHGYCVDHVFTYQVQDAYGRTAQATVNVKIQ